MNIGRNILELRKQKNITQEELAAELGVTAAAVSKWENGYTLPDILMLCALADFFEVTTDELLGRNGKLNSAIVVAQSSDLIKQIESIAREHGLAVTHTCTTYEDALDAATVDGHVRYVLVSCTQPLTQKQWDATPNHLCVIDSPNIPDNQVLSGFEEFFKMNQK